ncbi:MAG: hypothetical protein K1X88_20500 [Nannocystaceae bacterium]|nr:hypothetical protein [Nannocystaceae bacterium]
MAVGASAPASAAPKVRGADGKRFRLHFDTNIFDFSHFNRNGGNLNDPGDRVNSVGFGIGRPRPIDSGYPGPLMPRNVFGIGFGYVFLQHRAIVGARAALLVDGSDVGDNDGRATVVAGQIVPYFHWMFLPGRWVRPYVEGRVGFGGGVDVGDEDVDNDGNRERRTAHVLFPTVGVGGGVHLFPVDFFSVDLGLDFDYVAPHGRDTFEDPDLDDTDWGKLGDGIVLGLRAGASVFF